MLPSNENALPVELSLSTDHGIRHGAKIARNDPVHARVLGIFPTVGYILDQQFGDLVDTRSYLLRSPGYDPAGRSDGESTEKLYLFDVIFVFVVVQERSLTISENRDCGRPSDTE